MPLAASLWQSVVLADPAAFGPCGMAEQDMLNILCGWPNANNSPSELSGWQSELRRFLRDPCQGKLIRVVTGLDIAHNLDGASVFDMWQTPIASTREVRVDAEVGGTTEDLLGRELDECMGTTDEAG